MFTIQVIESSTGKPAYYKKVQVFFNGWTRGHTRELYTDKNGEAHFDYDNGEGQIYVGSERMYEGSISGRKVVYI
jgi:hypothetical protein